VEWTIMSRTKPIPVPAPPLTDREKAVERLNRCVDENGADIIAMPASCAVYLNRYLANTPAECELLVRALHRGVPRDLNAYTNEDGYDDFVDAVIDQLAQQQSWPREDAQWAVEAWAEALGRPRGFVYEPPAEIQKYHDVVVNRTHEKLAQGAMLAIVGGGAFLGGFLATAIVPIFMWALDGERFSISSGEHGANELKKELDLAYWIGVFIVAGIVGLIGAVASIVGWVLAGGDERPWATASVAFGTALAMVFIAGFGPFPGLVRPIAFFVSIFTASYKCSARGGHY
jgi:hypothetical protein